MDMEVTIRKTKILTMFRYPQMTFRDRVGKGKE